MKISIFVTCMVKRKGFRLLDFSEAGIRDAIVVAIKEKEVGYMSLISLLWYLNCPATYHKVATLCIARVCNQLP